MDNLKGTKVFVLKCLFLCCIDLNHTPGPILFLLVEIIAVTFLLINSFTVNLSYLVPISTSTYHCPYLKYCSKNASSTKSPQYICGPSPGL